MTRQVSKSPLLAMPYGAKMATVTQADLDKALPFVTWQTSQQLLACEFARLREERDNMYHALLGIVHMDVYTPEGEEAPHDVMRRVAAAGLGQDEQADIYSAMVPSMPAAERRQHIRDGQVCAHKHGPERVDVV